MSWRQFARARFHHGCGTRVRWPIYKGLAPVGRHWVQGVYGEGMRFASLQKLIFLCDGEKARHREMSLASNLSGG